MRDLALTQGKVALVDDADYERVGAFKWSARQEKRRPHCWYAVRTIHKSKKISKAKTVYLHRVILDPLDGFDVDHKDGDGLNCQRSNLRVATRSQNNMNRAVKAPNKTGYTGIEVKRDRPSPYVARIHVNGRTIRSPAFATLEEAVTARAALVQQYYGEFA